MKPQEPLGGPSRPQEGPARLRGAQEAQDVSGEPSKPQEVPVGPIRPQDGPGSQWGFILVTPPHPQRPGRFCPPCVVGTHGVNMWFCYRARRYSITGPPAPRPFLSSLCSRHPRGPADGSGASGGRVRRAGRTGGLVGRLISFNAIPKGLSWQRCLLTTECSAVGGGCSVLGELLEKGPVECCLLVSESVGYWVRGPAGSGGRANLHIQSCEPTQAVLRTYTSRFANPHKQFCEPTPSVLQTYTISFANLHKQFCEPTQSVLRTNTSSFENLRKQFGEPTQSVLRTYTFSFASPGAAGCCGASGWLQAAGGRAASGDDLAPRRQSPGRGGGLVLPVLN